LLCSLNYVKKNEKASIKKKLKAYKKIKNSNRVGSTSFKFSIIINTCRCILIHYRKNNIDTIHILYRSTIFKNNRIRFRLLSMWSLILYRYVDFILFLTEKEKADLNTSCIWLQMVKMLIQYTGQKYVSKFKVQWSYIII